MANAPVTEARQPGNPDLKDTLAIMARWGIDPLPLNEAINRLACEGRHMRPGEAILALLCDGRLVAHGWRHERVLRNTDPLGDSSPGGDSSSHEGYGALPSTDWQALRNLRETGARELYDGSLLQPMERAYYFKWRDDAIWLHDFTGETDGGDYRQAVIEAREITVSIAPFTEPAADGAGQPAEGAAVTRPAAQAVPTANAEAACRAWLLEAFAADPDWLRNRDSFKKEAIRRSHKSDFKGNLSGNGFGRAWAAVAPDAGRSKPGRKLHGKSKAKP